jgi:hypothetical protein
LFFSFYQLKVQYNHAKKTGCLGPMVVQEAVSANLKTNPLIKCTACNFKIRIQSARGDDKAGLAASIAAVSAGLGYEQAKKMQLLMGLEFPDKNTFDRNLEDFNIVLTQLLNEVLEENREAEKRIAAAKGKIDKDGFYCIAVICDGGYSTHNNGITIYDFHLPIVIFI